MEQDSRSIVATPLLESVPSGIGSKLHTLGNIIVSVVGTGVLGLPFAFRIAGWLVGSLGVAIVGLTTYCCMLLLVGLCLGLMFTFPVMVHPVNEIVEGKLERFKWFKKHSQYDYNDSTKIGKIGTYVSCAIVVAGLAVLALCVPAFGVFASLVGSTVSALLSFVLPATFHLKLFGSSLHMWQKGLDFILMFLGSVCAVYGTYSTIVGV